jgi:hypothetical protein
MGAPQALSPERKPPRCLLAASQAFVPFICQTVGTTTRVTTKRASQLWFCFAGRRMEIVGASPNSKNIHARCGRQEHSGASAIEVGRWRPMTPNRPRQHLKCSPRTCLPGLGGFRVSWSQHRDVCSLFWVSFGVRIAAHQNQSSQSSGTGNGTRGFQPWPYRPWLVDYYHHRFFSSNFRGLCSLDVGSLKRSGLRFRDLGPWTFRQPHRDAGEHPLVPWLQALAQQGFDTREGQLFTASRRGSLVIGCRVPALGCLITACAGAP